jgi:hypothetical protein
MGNVMWSNTFNGGPIYQTPDSGYIFLSRPDSLGSPDILLIKVNSSGNLLWARDFPGPVSDGYRSGNSMSLVNDGGYIITDFTHITAHSGAEYYMNLNKTDFNGQSGCNETTTTVNASPVAITASGTATVVTSPVTTVTASSVNLGAQSISIYTVCSTTSIAETRLENHITVSPNPISPDGSITIFLNEDWKNADLTIFNITGQPLYAEKVNGKGKIVLDALKDKLSAGLYFVRVVQGEKTWTNKIVLMK